MVATTPMFRNGSIMSTFSSTEALTVCSSSLRMNTRSKPSSSWRICSTNEVSSRGG